MSPLVWSVLLLLCGLALICAEVFIPSGGLLGFLSIASLLSGVGMAFYYGGIEVGLIYLIVTAVAVPGALSLAFRYWPETPMGRRLLLGVPKPEEVMPDSPQRQRLRQLVGRFGVARTMMMPSGAIEIDGQTVDALSEGMSIEPGQPIEVIEVRGTRVLVRAADPAAHRTPAGDLLSQPLESLGIEGFDEPLS